MELAVIVAANLAATLLRFVLLRHWVFRQRTTPASPTHHAPVSTPHQTHTSTTHETHATKDDAATAALTITEGHLR